MHHLNLSSQFKSMPKSTRSNFQLQQKKSLNPPTCIWCCLICKKCSSRWSRGNKVYHFQNQGCSNSDNEYTICGCDGAKTCSVCVECSTNGNWSYHLLEWQHQHFVMDNRKRMVFQTLRSKSYWRNSSSHRSHSMAICTDLPQSSRPVH